MQSNGGLRLLEDAVQGRKGFELLDIDLGGGRASERAEELERRLELLTDNTAMEEALRRLEELERAVAEVLARERNSGGGGRPGRRRECVKSSRCLTAGRRGGGGVRRGRSSSSHRSCANIERWRPDGGRAECLNLCTQYGEFCRGAAVPGGVERGCVWHVPAVSPLQAIRGTGGMGPCGMLERSACMWNVRRIAPRREYTGAAPRQSERGRDERGRVWSVELLLEEALLRGVAGKYALHGARACSTARVGFPTEYCVLRTQYRLRLRAW